jgi:hypothetical protein
MTRPPWRKMWKGPLPPPRQSSKRTVGDVLLPALRATGTRQEGARDLSVGIQNPTGAKRSDVGPGSQRNKQSGFSPADSFAKPNRRLVSPIVVHHPISYTAALTPPTPTTPISYTAAVMAGGHGGRRGAPAGQRAHRGRGRIQGATHMGKGRREGRMHRPPRSTLPCPTVVAAAVPGGGGGSPRQSRRRHRATSKGGPGWAPVWPPN